ncbi:MAG TPA: DUF423 domain-containing protein [Pricia sp.]|nr:DUF423 domain-containing protein [Pricia sp.]
MITVLIAQTFGALYGLLAILFGAFGAHALKKSLSVEQLKSFETGVKYQMYHAILLVILGFNFNLDTPLQEFMVYCFVIGTFLFSFSIYGLAIRTRQKGTGSGPGSGKWKFLGPVTPLGGLLLMAGWALLLYQFIGRYF